MERERNPAHVNGRPRVNRPVAVPCIQSNTRVINIQQQELGDNAMTGGVERNVPIGRH